MSVLDSIAKLASGTPAGAIASAVGDVLDRVLPDPELKRQAQQQAFDLIANGTYADKAAQAVQLAQIDVNKADAEKGGVHFRDGAGWVCVAGFAFAVARPVIEWGGIIAGHPLHLPAMDTSEIVPMLLALLGVGTLHAAERMGARRE